MSLPVVTANSANTGGVSASVTKAYIQKKLGNPSPYQFVAIDLVPQPSNQAMTFNAQTETINTYGGSASSINVVTGRDGQLTIETLSQSDDPVVNVLVKAGFAIGADAEIWFAFRLAEGSWIKGVAIVEVANPLSPSRGAARWSFPIRTTGEFFFDEIGVND